jgi:CheY-like chemotaxis protein/anti-sigma regulatory factor (Ser/Thr protein kinase)
LILFSDQEFIRKTLSYLLDNAVKFTHSGEVSFGYLKKNSSLEFFVKDTGIGIPKELQSVIFEHFMQEESSITRGYDGSGLGLSISNRLIKLLGGEFRVESEKGKGSIFLFTIPYKELESGMNNTVERNILVPFIDKPVILIVEDDEPGYHLMERMLRNTSASVISVRNAKDAVIRCREHPEISLVLMDLKIPNFNPIEATHEIKSFRQDLPVIAVADFVMSVDEKRVLEAGCDDCITKPVSPEVLLAKLKLYGVVINYQQEKC